MAKARASLVTARQLIAIFCQRRGALDTVGSPRSCPLWVISGHVQRNYSCLLWAKSGPSLCGARLLAADPDLSDLEPIQIKIPKVGVGPWANIIGGHSLR
jgi:hypothetical protein